MKNIRNRQGFTIVELLIATTILSVVLVGASFVLVQVGRLYYKATITSRTQSAARNIVDSISRPIQLQGSSYQVITSSTPAPNIRVVCVGLQRFTYQTATQVGNGAGRIPHAVWRNTLSSPGDCGKDIPDLRNKTINSNGESMLSDGMLLHELSIQPNGDNTLYTITVRVGFGEAGADGVYATNDLGEVTGCKGQVAGGQFCAYSSFVTTVNARIR